MDPKGLRKYDKAKLHDFGSIIKRGENDAGQLTSQLESRIAKILSLIHI